MPDEPRFDYQSSGGAWPIRGGGVPAIGGEPSFEVKTKGVKELTSQLTGVVKILKDLGTELRSVAKDFGQLHSAAAGGPLGLQGRGFNAVGGSPRGGMLTTSGFTRTTLGAMGNVLGSGVQRLRGAIGGGGQSTITAASVSGGAPPTGGERGPGNVFTYGATAVAAQQLGEYVGARTQAITTPGVSADFMARQFMLMQGRAPTGISGMPGTPVFGALNTITRAAMIGGMPTFNSSQDLAQGFGTLSGLGTSGNARGMLGGIRSTAGVSALMPQLGFGGSASLVQQFQNPLYANQMLYRGGVSGVGRGGTTTDPSQMLQSAALLALTGNPRLRGMNPQQLSRGNRIGQLGYGQAGSQILEQYGLSPDAVSAVQSYLRYSSQQGRWLNLSDPNQLKKAGVTASELQSFNTLGGRGALGSMQAGVSAQDYQRTINLFEGHIKELIGSAAANTGFAGLGVAVGNLTKQFTEAIAVFEMIKALGAARGLGGLLGAGRGAAGAAGEAAGGASLLSRLGLSAGKLLKGGAYAAGGTLAAGAAQHLIGGKAGRVVGSAGRYAAMGAGIGALGLEVPVVGEITTGAGALIGGAYGALKGLFGDGSYYRGVGDGPLQGPGHASGLKGSFLSSLEKMFADNPKLVLNSGYRSAQQQAQLYAAYKSGKGNLAAPPGHSMHEQGLAADIGPADQYGWLASNARKYGIYIPMPNQEPWHVQPLGVTGTNAVEPAPTTTPGSVSSGTSFGMNAPGFAYANQFGSTDLTSMLGAVLGARGGPNVGMGTGGGGGGGTSSTATAGGGNVTSNMSVVQAVRSVTSDPHVRLAMLMGSALESNQNPNAVGAGSYGPWQIQMMPGRDVTPTQAKDPGFAASFMVGRYTSSVRRVAAGLWSSNPQLAGEQAAYYAEQPAADYYATQGAGRVASAYAMAKSEMGDGASARGHTQPIAVVRGGGGSVKIDFHVIVASASEAEARRFAAMAAKLLKDDETIKRLASA